MTAPHIARPTRRRKPAPAAPAQPYPPGHFTELIRRHNWPPRFEPQYQRTREVEMSESSRIHREAQMALGNTGTIVGLTARADDLMLQRLTAARAVR